MKPRKPPTGKHNLFPDTWVIGTAAAALAKNDEGVLLADEPDRAPGSVAELQPGAVTPLSAAVLPEPRRPIEEELAELRAENERLRRCIAASRNKLTGMNWRDGEIPADQQTGFFVDPQRYPDDGPRSRRGRAGTGARSALIGAALVIAVGLFAAVLLAGQRLATLEGPMVGRMQTLRADIVGAVDGLGQRAIAWVRPAAGNRGNDATASGMSSQD